MQTYAGDYHTHSKYSFDGSEEMAAMCEVAIRRGLTDLAITDHLDLMTDLPYGTMYDFEAPGAFMTMDIPARYAELGRIKALYEGRLNVKVGVEIGQPFVNKPQTEAFMADFGDQLDFIIGSVHDLLDDRDVYYFDFEKNDFTAMYDEYVSEMLKMAAEDDFDVMGHLTYPLRYLFERTGRRADLAPYEDRFRALFRLLIESGRGIEMNVSGMFKPMQETMPTIELLKLYRACGGEIITIGSDAHKTDTLGLWKKEGQALLRSCGFKYVTGYTGRKPEFHRL